MAEAIKLFLKRSLKENPVIYCLIPAIFIFGYFFGMLGVNKLDNSQVGDLLNFIDGYITNLPTATIDATGETQLALLNNLKTLFYIWFLGLVIIGIPLTLTIIFFRGFMLGFTTSFLISQKSLQGMLVVLMTVLPQNLILIPVMLGAAISSISFSIYIIKGKFAGRALNLSKGIISYSFFFIILGLFAFLSALTQGYLSPLLVKSIFYFIGIISPFHPYLLV